MPHHRTLQYPHHTFGESEIRGPAEQLRAEAATSASNRTASESFSPPGERLRRGGVGAIVLVHGTFAGNDIAGMVREISRFSPISARRLQELSKHWLDQFVGEVGNFTEAYAERVSDLVNEQSPTIPIRRFQWSGENHHLGRADGVMALVETIDSLHLSGLQDQRVLVLAHSHGGNLLAMLSLIVGSDRGDVENFFDQTRLHYHSPIRRKHDLRVWQRVRERLLSSQPFPKIDVATFGTPLRYRWNRSICPKLLHFVQHRIVDVNQPTKAVFPDSIKDLNEAEAGDYVQHLGIAGTDFLPSIFAWRDWIVERRMGNMFERTSRRRDIWRKLCIGRRESSDGSTLLVDYRADQDDSYRQLFGHGVYTCHQWLPFHLREITKRFYDEEFADGK